jgi:histidine triad (HIT) family protein
MDSCIFCRIINREIPAEIAFEDEKTIAFLDIGPVSRGHIVLIPKIHAINLCSGQEEDALAIMRSVYELAPKVVQALGATGYNLGMNHGVDAGQEVMHTHVHIMPRYQNDERQFVKMHPTSEELHEVAESIRKEIAL